VGLVHFFFQAEDGIRDFHVTGVQTCALPIYRCRTLSLRVHAGGSGRYYFISGKRASLFTSVRATASAGTTTCCWRSRSPMAATRSEERRVGKECSSRGSGDREKNKEESEDGQ